MCDLPTLANVYWYKTEIENFDVFASNINRGLKLQATQLVFRICLTWIC